MTVACAQTTMHPNVIISYETDINLSSISQKYMLVDGIVDFPLVLFGKYDIDFKAIEIQASKDVVIPTLGIDFQDSDPTW